MFRPPEDLFTPRANYRNTDPATSRDGAVAHEKSGNAARSRIRCLEAVTERPGMTAGEYAEWQGVPRNVFSRRLPELRESGYVRNGSVRKCNVSHVKNQTWYPTRGQ